MPSKVGVLEGNTSWRASGAKTSGRKVHVAPRAPKLGACPFEAKCANQTPSRPWAASRVEGPSDSASPTPSMADYRDGRFPKPRRQRHRLQFLGQTPPLPVPQRTDTISPLTLSNIQFDRHVHQQQRIFQLEQNTPSSQNSANARKDTRLRPYVATAPPNAAIFPEPRGSLLLSHIFHDRRADL